jgi:hypothetical protein
VLVADRSHSTWSDISGRRYNVVAAGESYPVKSPNAVRQVNPHNDVSGTWELLVYAL